MRLALLLLALTGCPKPIPPPSPPPDGTPFCVPSVAPGAEAVCDGIFTADGTPCVNCGSIGSCYDERDAVYCVSSGGCLGDPLCAREQLDTARRKRKAVKHEAH